MYSEVEICASNVTDQCLLDNVDPMNPLPYTNKTCYQGVVSRYYIEVETPGDIIAVFQFSKETEVGLSIKNSGHDFVGRNSRKGSLVLRTCNLKDLVRDPRFVPEGCGQDGVSHNIITVRAGINFDEVYHYAETNNVTFISGYANTIRLSGGFVQMGERSILSPVYGLGVNRVVQYKVITLDGICRIANDC